jgi:GNAT superfamily N-acetyltransferase
MAAGVIGVIMSDRLSRLRIVIEPSPEVFEEELERRLLTSLRQNSPASDYAPFGVIAWDEDGEIAGGLVGGTSYGWLLVKVLWVADEIRGQGLGARIMAFAEHEALRRGCHGAWLDTSSARAKGFYERLGFAVFGRLKNQEGEQPPGHARFFLCKRFRVQAGSAEPEGKA